MDQVLLPYEKIGPVYQQDSESRIRTGLSCMACGRTKGPTKPSDTRCSRYRDAVLCDMMHSIVLSIVQGHKITVHSSLMYLSGDAYVPVMHALGLMQERLPKEREKQRVILHAPFVHASVDVHAPVIHALDVMQESLAKEREKRKQEEQEARKQEAAEREKRRREREERETKERQAARERERAEHEARRKRQDEYGPNTTCCSV